MSEQRAAENAVLDYLQRVYGWDRDACSRFLHRGIALGWFSGANVDAELARLVVVYRNAAAGHSAPAAVPLIGASREAMAPPD
jgi:hypothetical protein